LLEAGATRLVGLDRDLDALARAAETLAPWRERVELVHADYRAIADVLDQRQIAVVDGTLADLGVSSMQFDAPGRGFSFQRDEPLDMRMDRSQGETAADFIARATEVELADTIFRYGEERFSRRIARALVETRRETPVTSTAQLAVDRAALDSASRLYAHRSRDPDFSSTPDLGQPRARRPRSLSRGAGLAAARRRAVRHHHVSFARGSDRESTRCVPSNATRR
jgi:16S rRNA (cytosine(1402)-N(4))-methyltransferase